LASPWTSPPEDFVSSGYLFSSPSLSLDSPPHQFPGDGEIPDDFVGVLNVGYPLRPSAAHYGLSGLGLSGLSVDTHPGELRETSEDMDVLTSNPEDCFESPESFFSSPTKEMYTMPEFVGDWYPIANDRDLFVIAEEGEEDLELPSNKTSTPQFEEFQSADEAAVSTHRLDVLLTLTTLVIPLQ
jgi:hypothetical protein